MLVTVMPGPQLIWAGQWCRRLKREHPALTIVWGGYFPSIYTEAVCRDPGVDLVVRGQGEDTVVELWQACSFTLAQQRPAQCAIARRNAHQHGLF